MEFVRPLQTTGAHLYNCIRYSHGLRVVAWNVSRWNLLVVGTTGPVSEFTRQLKEVKSGKTTAYYCVGQTCRLPETDPAILADWLREDRSSEKSPAAEEGGSPPPVLE